MSNDLKSGTPANRMARRSERRASRRCKFTQLMRIRPSDPQHESFEDLRSTVSVSRTGIYFRTTETAYQIGMRLFVTKPFSQDQSTPPREYLAEVVRKDALPNGMTGIGIKMLLDMSSRHEYSFDAPMPSA